MASPSEIGKEFIRMFYTLFDQAKTKEERAESLSQFYHQSAMQSFVGEESTGRENIAAKHMKLQFDKIQHQVTDIDCLPIGDGGILISVSGQLLADNDKVLPFYDTFILRPFDPNVYLICNEIFRIALHDFA